ncbi:histidinol-phosphate transaminase [Candidatus Phycosocius spiralis]|uniref:Histidinol-phosphate aminotransferase n=1 Tax=Candidatus Phycosocius spiralis TaxID=2815099 RepID=A0ABQ4PW14_9PROT|nr:histidinol-phosphate transaminase [Candidatus Phycosocius spiralis]GIU67161.1 histidinol-phosphate aminotransferase [Candidatus Phycosocius spiralis]
MPVTPLPGILDIAPYKGGEAVIAGIERPWKLSSNENPLGCSPLAQHAYQTAAKDLATYPDGDHAKLREAIAQLYGLDRHRIMCGNGSDEIFQLLGRAFLDQGDEVVQSEHGFLVYRLTAQQAGAVCISAPETHLTANVDALLACVTAKTKLLFLANPNNPTGTYLPYAQIKRLHADLPEHVLLVLDAAYSEYVLSNDYASGLELAGEANNVLMTRTFSKIHGLAAARVGWCYGPQIVIDALNRVRGPFNVSAPGLAAAEAAILDHAFCNQSIAFNSQWLDWMSRHIAEIGLDVVPSVGNFILVKFPSQSSKSASMADSFLRSRGVIVRPVRAYGLDDYLRISIGLETPNRLVVSSLEEFMGQP